MRRQLVFLPRNVFLSSASALQRDPCRQLFVFPLSEGTKHNVKSLKLMQASMTQNKKIRKKDEDVREAWALRAGAELWKAVIAEADRPAEDTQQALEAVRHALDCARRLRCAGDIPSAARRALEAECDDAADRQRMALQHWGRGRGMTWEKEWGTQWGETLQAGNP
jgi:hypothetical protein